MTEASYFTVSFTRFYIKEYLKDKNVQTKATVDDLILSADKDFGNNKNGTNKLIVSEVSKKID
jgi:predicted transcriptional regulator